MLHIALCDDNPASIEILEKYFDILNDSTIDYDVYFSAEELYRYKPINEQIWKIAQNYTANFINESKSLLSFAHWKR